MGFCLFGVYALNEDGKVYVKNPTSCKTDCPACARVCPETAIIFPKYPNPPINGGELKEGDAPFEPVKVDLTTMTRGDVLQALRERNMNSSRFSPDPGRLKAVQERFAHLSGAKVSFDIPLDVLASRPGAKKESE
jgi:ferredoxin